MSEFMIVATEEKALREKENLRVQRAWSLELMS